MSTPFERDNPVQKRARTIPATLIVVSGKGTPSSVSKLRELLGGPRVVDIYLDEVSWGSTKSKIRFLRDSLLRHIVVPLRLALSVGKYSRVICYFGPSGYLLGIRNLLIPKHRRPRVVWVGFAPAPKFDGLQGQIKEVITYLALRGFDLIICHAKPLVESLRQRYPQVSGKVNYLRWGENITWLDRALPEVIDEGYVFCGGRTNRDFETVLAAVRELDVPSKLAMGSDVKLRGGVPKNVQVYRDVSYGQFEKLMCKSRVVVIALARPEIASGQLVLRKAMMCGKAVVVTDTAGMDDYASDGCNALFVKPHDPVDLREKLELLLADSNLRTQLGKAGYITAKELNNGEVFAKELAQLITQSGC